MKLIHGDAQAVEARMVVVYFGGRRGVPARAVLVNQTIDGEVVVRVAGLLELQKPAEESYLVTAD